MSKPRELLPIAIEFDSGGERYKIDVYRRRYVVKQKRQLSLWEGGLIGVLPDLGLEPTTWELIVDPQPSLLLAACLAIREAKLHRSSLRARSFAFELLASATTQGSKDVWASLKLLSFMRVL